MATLQIIHFYRYEFDKYNQALKFSEYLLYLKVTLKQNTNQLASIHHQRMQQKIQKLIAFLPQFSDIFLTYAEFETVQNVPEIIKKQYFLNHIPSIAKMYAEGFYKDKDADSINKDDITLQFMEWLEESGVKFKLSETAKEEKKQTKKTEPEKRIQPEKKIEKENLQKNQPLNQRSTPAQQTFTQGPYITSGSTNNHPVSPRPATRQPTFQPQSYQPSTPQQAPRTHGYHPQGRPNQIKYVNNSYYDESSNNTQASYQSFTLEQNPQPREPTSREKQAHMQRKLQQAQMYERQTYGWLDGLYKCLTYPEKRFYIMAEMHSKKKF